MFVSTLVFRNTLKVKSAFTGTTVFKSLLEKCLMRRSTNFLQLHQNCRTFFTSSQRQITFTRLKKSSNTTERYLDDSKKILNNVLIFKFERPTSYMVIIGFAFIQLFGMISMVDNVYRTFCQDLFEEAKSWKQRIDSHAYSLFAIAVGCICGPLIFGLIIFFASRTIRRIILHKGAKEVTIVTYNLIPGRRVFTESLENISCKASRTFRSTLPLTVKGTKFYYFIDTDGDIPNTELFDFTIGVKRDLK